MEMELVEKVSTVKSLPTKTLSSSTPRRDNCPWPMRDPEPMEVNSLLPARILPIWTINMWYLGTLWKVWMWFERLKMSVWEDKTDLPLKLSLPTVGKCQPITSHRVSPECGSHTVQESYQYFDYDRSSFPKLAALAEFGLK